MYLAIDLYKIRPAGQLIIGNIENWVHVILYNDKRGTPSITWNGMWNVLIGIF